MIFLKHKKIQNGLNGFKFMVQAKNKGYVLKIRFSACLDSKYSQMRKCQKSTLQDPTILKLK